MTPATHALSLAMVSRRLAEVDADMDRTKADIEIHSQRVLDARKRMLELEDVREAVAESLAELQAMGPASLNHAALAVPMVTEDLPAAMEPEHA